MVSPSGPGPKGYCCYAHYAQVRPRECSGAAEFCTLPQRYTSVVFLNLVTVMRKEKPKFIGQCICYCFKYIEQTEQPAFRLIFISVQLAIFLC